MPCFARRIPAVATFAQDCPSSEWRAQCLYYRCRQSCSVKSHSADGLVLADWNVVEQVKKSGYVRLRPTRSTVDPNDPTLWRYLSRKLGHLRREVLVALFCDDRGGFLTEEVLACGSRGSVIVPARLLIQRALAVDARSFLLVHNHPSGDPRSSIQDEQQTVSIRALAQQLELRMLGHLIVAGNRVARVGVQEA